MGRTFRFEDVAEALPELATDVDEVRGVEDLRVHSCVRVEIVVRVVVRIHAARFVLHAQRLDEKSCAVKHFSDIFSDIFLAFTLDNRPGVKEKSVQKRKIFLRKSLTRPNLPEYNGVSQGDTPLPPRGGGGSRCCAKVLGTLCAVFCFSIRKSP